MPKSVQPSISERAFDCPHCGAYTTQTWYSTYARRIQDEHTPNIPDMEDVKGLVPDENLSSERVAELKDWAAKMADGKPFFQTQDESSRLRTFNLSLSLCFHCNGISIWVHDRLLYPPLRSGAAPNSDLPPNVLLDYEEARSILDLSPRGAAALLRLCIQKLCIRLGEKGKNIDDDIASLVAKGLNPLVQKSLDVVRVIGNEAVHPGTMDLKDDRDTASALFSLINAIADQMITHPKQVETLYGKLPPAKLAAIEARDAKKKPEGE